LYHKEDLEKFSEEKLYEGRKECIECHEAKCQIRNRKMIEALLKEPGQDFKRACLTCHKSEEYEEKLNVHDLFGVMGAIKEDKCKFCHEVKVKGFSAFSFKAPLKFYCISCHPKQANNHPYEKTHLNLYVTNKSIALPIKLVSLIFLIHVDQFRYSSTHPL